MERLQIFLCEGDEAAPQGILRGNGIGLEPTADGKLVEVVARFAGAVEVGDVKAVRRGIVRGHESSAAGREKQRRKDGERYRQDCKDAASGHVDPFRAETLRGRCEGPGETH